MRVEKWMPRYSQALTYPLVISSTAALRFVLTFSSSFALLSSYPALEAAGTLSEVDTCCGVKKQVQSAARTREQINNSSTWFRTLSLILSYLCPLQGGKQVPQSTDTPDCFNSPWSLMRSGLEKIDADDPQLAVGLQQKTCRQKVSLYPRGFQYPTSGDQGANEFKPLPSKRCEFIFKSQNACDTLRAFLGREGGRGYYHSRVLNRRGLIVAAVHV